MDKNINNSLEALDLLTIASFIIQIQSWNNNSKYTNNIHTRLDNIFQRLNIIEAKIDKLLKEK